jgi:hypothetical protein
MSEGILILLWGIIVMVILYIVGEEGTLGQG